MTFTTRNNLKFEYRFGMNMVSRFRTADLSQDGFDADVLELPYNNENFRMLLILPHRNIQHLDFKNLNHDSLDSKLRSKKVEIKLPRFKIEYEASVKEALKDL